MINSVPFACSKNQTFPNALFSLHLTSSQNVQDIESGVVIVSIVCFGKAVAASLAIGLVFLDGGVILSALS